MELNRVQPKGDYMQYHFTFHGVKPSAFLEKYTKDKLDKPIDKLMIKPSSCYVSFTKSGLETVGQVHLIGSKHHQFIVRANTVDAYSVVDLIADKLRRQIVRYCETVKKHHHSFFEHHNLGRAASFASVS